MTQLNSSLSLMNPSDALYNLAMQHPTNSDDKLQLLGMASKFHQANQTVQQKTVEQNPPDGYTVKAPDGKLYMFQDQQSASEFKKKINPPGVLDMLGGMAQSIAQPFEVAAGSAIRGIQATPQLFSGDWQGAEQTMEKPIFGQKTAAGMNNEELLGTAAKAASFLAPGVGAALGMKGIAAGATGGALTGGLFSGGEAATQNASLKDIATSAMGGAAGGAVLGAIPGIIQKAAPKLKSLISPVVEGSSPGTVYESGVVGTKKVVNAWKGLGEEMGAFSKELDNQFRAKITLTPDQVSKMQEAARTAKITLPEFIKDSVPFEMSSDVAK